MPQCLQISIRGNDYFFLVHTLTVAFVGLKTNNVEKSVVVLVRSTKHFVIGEPSMEKEREYETFDLILSMFSLTKTDISIEENRHFIT